VSSSSSVADLSILNSSGNHSVLANSNDLNNSNKIMNEPSDKNISLSVSVNSNIESTIDGLMDQYKIKGKKNKSKDSNVSKQSLDDQLSQDDEDENEEEEEEEKAKDKSNDDLNNQTELDNEDEKSKKSKTKRRLIKKKTKINDLTGESNQESGVGENLTEGENLIKKRRKYTKKKATILQMDELSISTQEAATNHDSVNEANSNSKIKLNDGDESLSINLDNTQDDTQNSNNKKPRGKKTVKDLTSDVIIASNNRSGVGRKKSLVKLMKKSQRKKRKRTSSGEEEIDDDSDDFEMPCSFTSKNNLKKEEISTEGNDASDPAQLNNDEEAAKILQANESRRSTRNKANKRSKYTDDFKLKDEDLILPPTEADIAAEAAEAVAAAASQNSNIVLTSQDSLTVDKILGMRLFKRKTKRKKEKKAIDSKIENTVTSEENLTNEENITKNKSIDLNLSKEEILDDKLKMIKAPEPIEEEKINNEKIKTENVEEEQKNIENKINEKNDSVVIENNKPNFDDTKLEAKIENKIEIEENKQENTVENEIAVDKLDEESEYEEDGGEIEVEEFFVKYKNFSYLHCEWRTRDELFVSDKRIDQKIKRFKLKKSQANQYEWNENDDGYNNEDDELFNPDYVEVERILDVFDMEDASEPNSLLRYYLIKWKTLPYDESSWELESDIKNPKKLERFYKFNTLIPDIHQRLVPRPRPDKWNQLKESRIYKNGNSLREYQLEGINWLTFCWLNARNCILADEMGLGKTIQSITFLQEIANYGVNGPFLVLVPLSTIGNWMREFETWTDFNAIVYHGSSISRQMIQDYEFYFKENGTSPDVSNSIAINPDSSKKNIVKFNALITTYEVLMSDVTLFCQFKWRNVIIDEAHRLKNKNCKLMEGLRYMDVEHKVLLTGTPLQNNVEELFSLLHFLEPQQFHSSQEFLEEFGDLKTDTQVTKLQAVLKPMMLRRLKEDVEKNLALKEETIVEVELTNTQKKFYRAILEKNFEFLYKGVTNSNMPNLMNTMMELRKCCNHPYLINGNLNFMFFLY
jgi:chromodomain-helicase-DNA-binding protein 7